MKITDFCRKHNACSDGREWALSTGCKTMEELWKRDDIRPDWRIWIATRPGVMDGRDLRLWACWCVRQVWSLLTDGRSRNAVEVAERYAVGKATNEELAAAAAAAWEAAWTAAAAAAAWTAAAAEAAAEAAEEAAAWAATAAEEVEAATQAKKLMEYRMSFMTEGI